MAFLEYMHTACVTATVSPSAFIETSLCTLHAVSPLFYCFLFIVAKSGSCICDPLQQEIFVESNVLIL